MPEDEPSSAPQRSDFSDWVLLDTVPTVIGRCNYNNATTARAMTSGGDTIGVSFELADPPGLSRCVVHCSAVASPSVAGADGAFLLLRLKFPRYRYRSPADVFLYRAGPGAPSLHRLPRPYPANLLSNHVAILSSLSRSNDNDDHEQQHCLVVVPEARFEQGRLSYDLQIFSTETGAWSTTVAGVSPYLRSCFGRLVCHYHRKVLNVGGGTLAWVDLRHGMLLCNVLDDRPVMDLITLPGLMPANVEFYGDVSYECGGPSMRSIRDVTCTCTNGSIRFVEVERLMNDDNDDTNTAVRCRWKATVFKMTIYSGNGWEWCRTVDSANLSPADSCFPELFPRIWNEEENALTLAKVISHSPILDMYHDDVVYLTSKMDARDTDGWMLSVNTRNNKLERAVPFSTAKTCFEDTKLQCAFSKYLSWVPE